MYKVHLKRALFFTLVGFFVGLIAAKVSRPLYEAKSELLIGSVTTRQGDNDIPDEIRRILQPVNAQSLDSDIGLLKSQAVFGQALQDVALQTGDNKLLTSESFRSLFEMYDVIVPPSTNQYQPDPSKVVTIRARAYSPRAAAMLANACAEQFNDMRQRKVRAAVGQAIDILNSQTKTYEQMLAGYEKEYRDYKVANNLSDLSTANTQLAQNVGLMEQTASQAESELAGTRLEIASLVAQMSKSPRTQTGSNSVGEDPTVTGYRGEIVRMEAMRAELLRTYLPDSIEVRKVDETLRDIRRKMASYEKTKYTQSTVETPNPIYQDLASRLSQARAKEESLAGRIESLRGSIDAERQRVVTLPQHEVKLRELDRKMKLAEAAVVQYSDLARNYQQQSEAGSTAAQIISMASDRDAERPVAPDVEKWVFLAAVAGAAVGLLYSFAMESLKLPVHTSWQLAELTSLPIAAAAPMLPKPIQRRRRMTLPDPGFRPAESFRYMAFSTLNQANRPKVMMFTGVGEGVGATEAATEFAISMARTGARTLLVDCDLRNRELTRIFKFENSTGVADILRRTTLPSEGTQLSVGTQHPNLTILPSGTEGSAGLADFLSADLEALLTDLKSKADMVILNCPACDVYADAARLASAVDQTCLVVSAKSTGFRAIPVAQDILVRAGATELQIVLTNASPTDEPFAARTADLVNRA